MFRRNPVVTAWGMTMAMATATAVLLATTQTWTVPLIESPAAWWMLAAGFVATDMRPVHITTKRGAHTLNPIEIPLIVALVVLAGPQIVLARVVASAVHLVLITRQEPLKAAFNVAVASLSASVAVVVASQAGTDLGSPWPWAVVALAAVIGAVVNAIPVSLVLHLFDSDRRWADSASEVGMAATQGFVASAVGLVISMGLMVGMWTVGVTAVLSVAFHTSLIRYGRLRRRHSELDMAYQFTRVLDQKLSLGRLSRVIVGEVESALRAPRVALLVGAPDVGLFVVKLVDGEITVASRDPERTDPGDVATPGQVLGLDDDEMLSIELRSGTERIGWLAVGGRSNELAFDEGDRALLEMMGRHSGAMLGRALVEDRLTRENTEKQELLHSKDQLIAAVSHELRTPLTGILGFSSLIADTDSAPDLAVWREWAGQISDEARDLSNIVEDLLTAARFELGQLTAQLGPAEVSELVERAVMPIEARSGRRFERHIATAPVWTDAPRARQIVRNLAANAVRYGGERLVVRSFVHGESVAIEVCDDGAGVPVDQLDRIFEPYQTAHPSSTQPGSVGLGLAISRELARLMNGDLQIHRRDGWTVFRLILPTAASEQSTPADTGSPIRGAAA